MSDEKEKITAKEFACKCCGKIKVDMLFLTQLRKAREIADVPFIIDSGYRCPKHNKEAKSTSMNHVMGRAADIRTPTNQVRIEILAALCRVGFKRIGIHEDYIHVDNMNLVKSCWLYK